ncbi:MAG: DUF6745 domain-containing protein [Geminicoccaceae bacterium]
MRRTESGLAPARLAEATADLYRCCERVPPRITIATHEPIEFAHLLQAAGRVYRFGDVALLVGCAVACAGLVAIAANSAEAGGGLLVLATFGSLLLLIIAFGAEVGAEPAPLRLQADLLGVLVMLVAAAVAAWWVAGSGRAAAVTFTLMAAGAGLGRAAVMVNGGVPGRLGLALWYGRSPAVFASAPLQENIRRALPRPGSGPAHPESRPDDPVRAELWHRIEEIGRRRTGQAWGHVEPVLGRSVALAHGRPRDLDGWGNSRPLAVLEWQCEAAALFDRAAVLLLPASAASTPPSRASARLRCAREPYARVLKLLQASPVLAAVLALAPTERIAERLLARTIAADPDATLRLDAMSHMGFERFFAALAITPVDRGRAGELYLLVGFAGGTAAVIRVEDRVRGPDGRPHVHWLPVPPDMSSAHEAVAWTFGKSARDWAPAVET